MHKVKTLLAYTSPDGAPVLSQEFSLDRSEGEVVALADAIASEGYGHIESGVYAVSALAKPDPQFVEFLTGGVFTLDAEGALTGDPAVLTWMRSYRGFVS